MLLALGARGAGTIALPGVGVEVAVPVELEHVPVELVGTRLDDVADDPARDVPDVGGVVVGLDTDLGDGVGARLVADAVVHGVVDLDPVHHEVVGLLPVAVDVGTRAGPAVRGVGLAAGIGSDGAGQEEGQLARVAAVQGQRLHGLAGKHLAHRRGFRLKDRRLRPDFHRVLEGPDLELEVHAGDLLRFERDRLRGRGLEARQLRLDHIGADRDGGDGVVSGLVGHRRIGHVRGLVDGADCHARSGGATRVGDDPGDRGRAGLGVRGRGREDEDEAEAECGQDARKTGGVNRDRHISSSFVVRCDVSGGNAMPIGDAVKTKMR